MMIIGFVFTENIIRVIIYFFVMGHVKCKTNVIVHKREYVD